MTTDITIPDCYCCTGYLPRVWCGSDSARRSREWLTITRAIKDRAERATREHIDLAIPHEGAVTAEDIEYLRDHTRTVAQIAMETAGAWDTPTPSYAVIWCRQLATQIANDTDTTPWHDMQARYGDGNWDSIYPPDSPNDYRLYQLRRAIYSAEVVIAVRNYVGTYESNGVLSVAKYF